MILTDVGQKIHTRWTSQCHTDTDAIRRHYQTDDGIVIPDPVRYDGVVDLITCVLVLRPSFVQARDLTRRRMTLDISTTT